MFADWLLKREREKKLNNKMEKSDYNFSYKQNSNKER